MDHETREKAGKIIGLLGSDHDGEIVNAARALKRLLASKKHTISDLVNVISNLKNEAPRAERTASKPRERADYNSREKFPVDAQDVLGKASHVLDLCGGGLRPHEVEFLNDMVDRAMVHPHNLMLSEKQINWLNYLYQKHG